MGRALMPVGTVALIAAIGWRETYAVCAVLVLVVLTPAVAWLLTSHARRETALALEAPSTERKTARSTTHHEDRSLRQVLRDPIFYLFLPAILAPSFFDTALSFHLLPIAALKSWSAEWVTTGYAVYAGTTIMASMWIGTLVDKIGAVRPHRTDLVDQCSDPHRCHDRRPSIDGVTCRYPFSGPRLQRGNRQ